MMKRSKDQKGMAMVSAIVLIAVIAIMASTLMQMSYLAYSRKVTERRTTETFYTAEAAVDTIKSYIQNTAASVLDEAKTGTADFAKAAYAKILGLANTDGLTVGTKIVVGSDGTKPAALTALENLLKKKIFYKSDGTTKKDDSAYYNGHVTTDIYDGIVTNGGDFSIGGIEIAKEGVRIKDVHIKFINNEGYVAEITTDIVITAPTYAADITVPLGTYSMFAGNGGTMYADSSSGYKSTAMNNLLYLHQEGAIYIGSKNQTGQALIDRPNTSLEIQAPANGAAYMSIGGTNAVFNGSIYVDNGNTLIFTGGNGKEGANVQVRGYIYLADGATLLLAPNVNLVCKGIRVKEKGESSYSAYSGTSVSEDGISQFFPATEEWIADNVPDKATRYTTQFNNGTIDHAEIMAGLIGGSTTADSRATDVSNGTAKCGVYILNADRDETNGWKDRLHDKYYLVKCIEGAFSCTQAGLYRNQIRCSEYDSMVDPEKLKIVPKVVYMGEAYDDEFATIINVPFLKLWGSYANSALVSDGNSRFTSYDPADDSTFKTITYQDIKTEFSAITNLISKFNFEHMQVSGTPTFGSRKLRIPTSFTSSQISSDSTLKGSLKIETNKRTYNANGSGLGTGIKGGDGVLQPAGNDYSIYISASAVKIHTTSGHYAGLFMSSDTVSIGQSTGVTRGVSLIDMAADTKINPGLDDENNPVRILLRRLAGTWICKSYYEDWLNGLFTSTSDAGAAFNIFDNCFNGGVQIFWERTKSSSSGSTGASDNTDVNFVDVDNWKKDAEPGAEETPAEAETGE